MTETLLNILILVVTVFSGVIPSVFDLRKNAGNRANPERKVLTKSGRFFILVMALLFVLTNAKLLVDKESDRKQGAALKTLDSLNKAIIYKRDKDSLISAINNQECINRDLLAQKQIQEMKDSLSRQMQSSAEKTNAKIDSAKNKEPMPTLDIVEPLVYEDIKGENTLTYIIRASNAESHIDGYGYIIVPYHNDTMDFYGDPMVIPGGTLNFASILYTDELHKMIIFWDRIKTHLPKQLPDTFALAIEYQYKAKNNVRHNPMRKIYRVMHKDKRVSSMSSYDFLKTALYLKKKKIWTKFYDL